MMNLQLFEKGISAVSKQELLTLIENKRAELLKVATTYGLSSNAALHYSQELDHLLNEYNRKFIKKIQQVH